MKLPHTILYTSSVPVGDAVMCKVRINPKYQFDRAIHAHEYEHVKQWYLTLLLAVPLLLLGHFYDVNFYIYAAIVPFLYSLLYKTRWFRSFTEVRAFRKQLAQYGTDKSRWAAKALAENYDLNINEKQAYELIKGRRR